jgi:HK97 family phage prohead protease
MSKESPKKTFVLSDESVNSYGFRVLTSGINLERFKKNPLMLWSHTRSWSDKQDTILPIGIWENLRVEDGKLLGDTCFDMDDPFAAKIANKVEKGHIKACSIGIEVLERSDAPEHIVFGQTRMTVTRCILNEVSITDIPANANAVSLYDDNGKMIELTAERVDCTIGLLNNNQNLNEKNMKLIALALGLSENATEAEIMAKVQELQALQAKLTEKDNEIATLKAAALEADKKTIEKLVNEAITAKKLTADQKANFIAIGEKMGVETLQTTLASMNGVVKPTDVLSGVRSTSVNTDKKWADLSAQERESLREDDRETYVALYEKEYGFKPTFGKYEKIKDQK